LLTCRLKEWVVERLCNGEALFGLRLQQLGHEVTSEAVSNHCHALTQVSVRPTRQLAKFALV
jgi:hypothetical protein